MYIQGVGIAHISPDGREVEYIQCDAEASTELAKRALLGPPAMFALSLRGGLCLHASAIQVGDRIVAFVGYSGVGKSTLARAIVRQWPRVRWIADDILALEVNEDGSVGLGLSHSPRVEVATERGLQRPGSGGRPARLQSVYVLQRAARTDSLTIRSSQGFEATIDLVRHTAMTTLYDRTMQEVHLRLCADLANAVSVSSVVYPHSMCSVTTLFQHVTCPTIDTSPPFVPRL